MSDPTGAAPWLSLRQLVYQIDEPQRDGCVSVLDRFASLFARAAGATHNHQTWGGGYVDHVAETMNLALALYPMLAERRELSFSVSDALVVLFLHDIEKPWVQGLAVAEELDLPSLAPAPSDLHRFRVGIAEQYGIALSEEQLNALRYIEGEGPDYTPGRRLMGRLAAFCHVCDTLSARLWFDRPAGDGETWGRRAADGSA